MDGTIAGLAGLGIAGGLVTLILCGLLFVAVPIWAIVDCLLSQRNDAAKAVLVTLTIVTLGLVGVIYGLFLTSTRLLRRFTLVLLVLFVLLGLTSIASCTAAGSLAHKEKQEARSREQ